MESILTSIKKLLGITEDYTDFDTDIIIHINSVIMILRQLGIGPVTGFHITDASQTWNDYLSNIELLESVKSYIYLKVRLLFDPPVGSVLDSMNNQVKELEWRFTVEADTLNS